MVFKYLFYKTALHKAAEKRNYNIIQLLVTTEGVDDTIKDNAIFFLFFSWGFILLFISQPKAN